MRTVVKLIFPLLFSGIYLYTNDPLLIILIIFFTVFNPIKPEPIKENINDDIKREIKNLRDMIEKIKAFGLR
jgi:hypothetical protein